MPAGLIATLSGKPPTLIVASTVSANAGEIDTLRAKINKIDSAHLEEFRILFCKYATTFSICSLPYQNSTSSLRNLLLGRWSKE